MNWFVWKNGRHVGPLSDAELRALIESGQVADRDVVCRAGSAAWTPLRLVPEFAGHQDPENRDAQGSERPGVRTSEVEYRTSENRGVRKAEDLERRSFIVRHWRGDLPLGVSY